MDKTEPTKIVDLPHQGPGKELPKQFVALLTGCRQQTQDFVAPLFDGLFGLVDDCLFDCADKARTNQDQTLYFEAMRTLRLERQAIERRLHRAIAERFNRFIEQRPQQDLDIEQLDTSRLSLIQRDEYEQVVTTTNLAAHAESRCNEALWALEQRFAVLNRGVKLDHLSNPAAPRALVRSLNQALAPLELEAPIIRVLHQLFQSEVLNNIDPLYDRLNQYLIEHRILPNLKHSPEGQRSIHSSDQRLSHRESSRDAGSSIAQPSLGSGAGAGAGAGLIGTGGPAPTLPSGTQAGFGLSASAPTSADLLHSITQLLGQRLHLSLPGELPFPSILNLSSAPPESPTYSSRELQQALSTLQAGYSTVSAVDLSTPVSVIHIKQQLVDQLEESSETPLAVATSDAEMIDLVGMLFDFILDDDELPDQVKALISHLHTPYLKVALADPELFENNEHPARQLLNLMARAACEWNDHPHNSRAIRQRISLIVERILQEFEEGSAVFAALLFEFEQFYQLLERQSAIVEQRAVEAAQGRDKLVGARLLADREINQAIAQQALPAILIQFLRGSWTDVLVFSYLRHGAHSPIWRQALDTLQQLCWSVLPKASEEEQAQLRRIQPELIHSLTQLLSQLGGLQAAQIRTQLSPLVTLQKAALGLEPLPAVTEPSAVPVAESTLGQEPVAEPDSASDLSELSEAIQRRLASLDFGCWFLFQEESNSHRLKLAWYSPTTHNYMFVDSAGNRAAVYSRVELGKALEDGRAQLIEKQRIPLVDRALKAIQGLLLRFTSGEKA